MSADGSAEVLAKQNAKVQAENDKLRLQLEEALTYAELPSNCTTRDPVPRVRSSILSP